MILSVSRRTDIPGFYSEWFFNRIKEGYLLVRNPLNPRQLSRIDLSPELVDCIVFWTKNPEPMLGRLHELREYSYYFQFTLTPYGPDLESCLPHKRDKMIPVFQQLSDRIGSNRVVWRYDPIIFTEKYTPEYHRQAFRQMAEALNGYTHRCVISFVDYYAKNKKNMESIGAYEMNPEELRMFARELACAAKENGMTIATCSEKMELAECGISHSSCIDKALVEEIIGCEIKASRDKNQRPECGCVESVEVGTYNTCRNGCKYCYANHSPESVRKNSLSYDPASPILCGKVLSEDVITERKVKSLRVEQLRLF